MLLEKKVALVTGAASGIGRATARRFAAEGAAVVVADINEQGGEETAELIRQEAGRALFVPTNVGNMEQVQHMVETAVAHFGPINVVVSNAAYLSDANAITLNEVEWDNTLNVCLKATWMIAHYAAPIMLEHGGGTFVITGSVHAQRGYLNATAYQAAKGGLLALTRSLAADLAPTIRVNTILPGAVVTGIWRDYSEEKRQKIAQQCILRRNGQPDEIANVALFLASNMSSYMTAAHVVVDGGLTAIIESP